MDLKKIEKINEDRSGVITLQTPEQWLLKKLQNLNRLVRNTTIDLKEWNDKASGYWAFYKDVRRNPEKNKEKFIL